MNISKIFWGIRAVFYKLSFKEISMPSYIGKPILLQNRHNISLGKRCRIYPGMRAELVDSNSFVKIGDNVSIGQNFHVVSYDDTLSIGNDVTISGNVMVSNCDHAYTEIDKHILDQPLLKNETKIGDGCFIGYGAVLLAGTVLGKHCVVGANSVVRGNFPDYSVIVGSPARIVKRYNTQTEKWERG